MSTILRLIQGLMAPHAPSHDRDEAYLAGAVDHYDLERRMRELDLRDRSGAPGPSPLPGH